MDIDWNMTSSSGCEYFKRCYFGFGVAEDNWVLSHLVTEKHVIKNSDTVSVFGKDIKYWVDEGCNSDILSQYS